ncbi:hypothetical protein [Dyella lutea]|uniref:Uncharacterized protein n=1 Tax=Dyella lutea TaxID=2950441 RepID=A0ABT1FFT4_9GAMM|nr:hypothetical protein [Dyella lutea]MCP1376253.1 hypothetical protein [Dyella lutea]
MSMAGPRPDPHRRRRPAASPWREVLPVLLAKLVAAAALGWMLFSASR